MSSTPPTLPGPATVAANLRARVQPTPRSAPSPGPIRLRDLAIAAVAAASIHRNGNADRAEDQWLQQHLDRLGGQRSLPAALEQSLRSPVPEDEPLARVAAALRLSPAEQLTVALAAAVEADVFLGRALAYLQAPIGGSRPTLGLLARALGFSTAEDAALLPAILTGSALQSGLLTLLNETAPLPERTVMVAGALCLALDGYDAPWTGVSTGLDPDRTVPLPASIHLQAQRHAVALAARPRRTLILRTGSPSEGRSAAAAIAAALHQQPAFIETDKTAGLGPWLLLRQLLPVVCLESAPGERRRLPELSGYLGPVLVVAGPDGAVESPHGPPAEWVLPVPSQAERRELWHTALGPGPLADQMALHYRHGAGRVAHLGLLARHHAALHRRAEPGPDDILAASWTGEGQGLDTLAEPWRTPIPDAALVAGPELRADLESLLQRCRVRDNLAAGLGASATARYRSGLRALFTGPSGTGKSLAAGWVATRLGMPLYRVDLASVTSKYIGETEKNLAQLLARAEQAEVILLFDEADSLFGKRTDISDANDRFANAQTNYLLQRIEHYDGIVLLTSNSQARFDPAFARRLDFVIEFPPPGPDQRRALWRSHLGSDTRLQDAELNQLAALVDLCGGHIRNAVLGAAVLARSAQRPLEFTDVLTGVELEYRKLGRQMPVELRAGRPTRSF